MIDHASYAGKCSLKSKYYPWNKKWVQEIDITVAMLKKLVYNSLWIMLLVESTFSGRIQKANPMHPGVVTLGCDRVGSTFLNGAYT